MTHILNIKRYIELLRKESSLNNQKKSLLFENKKEFLELLSYGSDVESQISYDRKNLYHSLIAKYLAKTITLAKFRSKFLKMQREDDEAATIIKNDLERLATFSIDFKANEFSSLIEQIYDVSTLAFELGPKNGIAEDRFLDSIEKAYLQIQKFLKE
jgi:hypothetical protein